MIGWIEAIGRDGRLSVRDRAIAEALHSVGKRRFNASLKIIGRWAKRFPSDVRRGLTQLEAVGFITIEPIGPEGFAIRLRLPSV